MNTSITVPFHGNTLFLVERNGEAYTPMRPIVEGMGLDWKSQYVKLKQRFVTCVVEITMQLPGDTQSRSVICMALRKLTGWLYTISANKVKPDLREKILQYQSECDDVLWRYWSKSRDHSAGSAVHIAGQTIGTDGLSCLAAVIDGKVRHLPAPARRSAKMHIWQQVHKAFSVVRAEQIPADKMDSARNFIAAQSVEGEWIGAEPAAATYVVTQAEANWLKTMFLLMDGMVAVLREVRPALRSVDSPLYARAYDSSAHIAMYKNEWQGLRDFCMAQEV